MAANAGAIMAKLREYANSKEGKAKMSATIQKYIEGDVHKTKAGSRVITLSDMDRAAHLMNTEIQTTAKNGYHGRGYGIGKNGIPGSVVKDSWFWYEDPSKPTKKGKYLRYRIKMGHWKHGRPSLDPKKYGGIQDIVALFNNGMHAPRAKYVYGVWHGNYIAAAPIATPFHYVNRAVKKFNYNTGPRYQCEATLKSKTLR